MECMDFEKQKEGTSGPNGIERTEPARSLQPKRRAWVWGVAVGAIVVGITAVVWSLDRRGGSPEPVAPVGSAADEAEQLGARVGDLREVADEHAAAGRGEEAREALVEAAELQREINERFAGLPQASASRLEEIEGERQSVEAAPVLAELARLDAEAATQLRKRDLVQALRIIAEAAGKMERATVDFPLARGVGGEMRERLGFLQAHHAQLGWMQDLAREGLTPDPAMAGTAQLETGPGWELYKRVMGAGAGSTAAERQEFCRRLGWVLGMRTRLAVEEGAARGAFLVLVETTSEAGN
jgi:hypothetical protein